MIIHGKKELKEIQDALNIVKASDYYGLSEEEEKQALSKLPNPQVIDDFIERIDFPFGIRRGIIDEIIEISSSNQDLAISIATKKTQMMERILIAEGKIQKKLTNDEWEIITEIMLYYSSLDIDKCEEVDEFYFYTFDLSKEVQ